MPSITRGRPGRARCRTPTIFSAVNCSSACAGPRDGDWAKNRRRRSCRTSITITRASASTRSPIRAPTRCSAPPTRTGGSASDGRAARPSSAPIIRSLDEDGWRSEHSVVEIVTDDMPFLVNSVTAELNRRDLTVDLIVHPVLRVRRDEHGQLQALLEPSAPTDEGWTESFMHIEVTRQPDRVLQAIADGVASVLADVRAAVGDWFEMRRRARPGDSRLGCRTGANRHSGSRARRRRGPSSSGSGTRISPSSAIESTTS